MKVTFTLDGDTLSRLRATAERLAIAKSAVVRVSLPRGRGREIDLAIAASALILGARLWTLNPRDFRDLAGLELYRAS